MTEQQLLESSEPGSGRARVESALAARLRAVAPLLVAGPLPGVDADPAVDAAGLLDVLVSSVVVDPANERIWLLLTAVGAAFPTRDEVDAVRRLCELSDPVGAAVAVLDAGSAAGGDLDAVIEVVTGAVLVDVDLTAKYEVHTGIQQVVRSLLPLWVDQRGVVPVVWTGATGGLRRLSETEAERVLFWATRQSAPATRDPVVGKGSRPGHRPVLVVPWRSVVVMVEVPPVGVLDRVAAVGQYSGNRLVGVLYDVIPAVSTDMVPVNETSKFVRYLAAVKFAARMAGISLTAAAELSGFVRALSSQGIVGPVVGAVALPTGGSGEVGRPPVGRPVVLVVGSHEPRKNHLAVLHSAEVLWREGVDFSLWFIGGSGWGEEFPDRVAVLQGLGRSVRVERAVSDRVLAGAYASAWFTVFPSLHEGFGLPVAESLSFGVPVITTGYGSTAEIGGPGGCVLVDPRDGRALTDAMRRLLGEPQVLAGLRAQIAGRPVRGWQDYADELWEFLVGPELAVVGEGGG